MKRFEDLPTDDDLEKQHEAWKTAIGETLKKAREDSAINVFIASTKPGISNINLMSETDGKLIHFVNAVSKSTVTIKDAKIFGEFPDILIDKNNYNLPNILKKISEHLNLNYQLQDIKITAYKNLKDYHNNNPLDKLDPTTGNSQNAA